MPPPDSYVVTWEPDAVSDFDAVRGRQDRFAIYTVVEKLRALGPRLAPPHTKTLDGFKPQLMELRPRQGRSDQRPLYRRFGDAYVILAVAPTHEQVPKFAKKAQERAERYR